MFIIYNLGMHKLTVQFGNMKQAGKQTQYIDLLWKKKINSL